MSKLAGSALESYSINRSDINMEGRSADCYDGPLEFVGGSGIQKLPPDDENTATLDSFLEKDGDHMSWERIEKPVTASALCEASNPIKTAFKVSRKLLDLAETTTVNTKSLEELAVKVQDFAFDLLDQVERKEDMYIKDEDMDRSGSLFSKITDNAIAEKQKKNRWKINYTYSRCVTEEQFRRMHCVVVPFNLLSLPLASLYWRMTKDTRIKRKDSKNNKYKDFLEGTFFPIITKRYKKKYKGSFPLTVDGKLDNLEERLNRVEKLKILEKKEQTYYDWCPKQKESQEPDRLEKMEEKRTMTSKGREKQKNRSGLT
ncbi:hypothetical protein AWC38_SpisGene17059 [Stylophora pistillata]|uniref:Uncharacterized protein n=1 Tax=Stylophora pistillata TaxID=50429 RepID=A0A2B4RP51_STYPI|nr:hypothetical protein AWC38_SpisGene17059 [Stylophora pistillata]